MESVTLVKQKKAIVFLTALSAFARLRHNFAKDRSNKRSDFRLNMASGLFGKNAS